MTQAPDTPSLPNPSPTGTASRAPSLNPEPSPPTPSAGSHHPTTITEFLTDGSLASLCASLSELLGVRVDLVDAFGRIIISRAKGTWEIAQPTTPAQALVPISIGPGKVGGFAIGAGDPPLDAEARRRLEAVLTLMAGTVEELCQHELELRHRLREIAALTKMSSLLVRVAGPNRVLEVALDSALDVLELDAGSIVLFNDNPDDGIAPLEEDIQLTAHRGLSPSWLNNPKPLGIDRVFDRLVVAGHMVVIEDLQADDRVNLKTEARAEGLAAAIQCGLTFNGRTLGVVRLYSRHIRSFEAQEKRLLASLAHQAAAALEQSRLLRFEQEEQRVQRQLQLAADVQRRMLPRGVPNVPQLDVAAKYIPSFELGGDFYDFIELSGHLGVVVGDVVGKGIAAALLMASVRSSLRAHAQEVYDLDEVVRRVNQALCRDTRDYEFASLWYGVIDPAKWRLTYCSAGHEPPMVIRRHPTSGAFEFLELSVGGMVVGIDPSQRYQRAVFDIRPHDVIVGYTDGLSDAVNFAGERYGKRRTRDAVSRLLTERPDATAADIVDRILWDLRQFAGLATRPDDLTLVVVRVKAKE